MTGRMYVPPIAPMLDNEIVPSFMSSWESLPATACPTAQQLPTAHTCP
jgi:hypothetical protein